MITIDITDRINSQLNDIFYADSMRRIINELKASVGEFKEWGQRNIVCTGEGWRIRVGPVQESQQFYVDIEDEQLAVAYILKYDRRI